MAKMLRFVTSRNTLRVLGMLVFLGAGAGLVMLWKPWAPGDGGGNDMNGFVLDPRILEARKIIKETRDRLIEAGTYNCCCTQPCTLCLLERGTCTCARDAAKKQATCGECLPRLKAFLKPLKEEMSDLVKRVGDDPDLLKQERLALYRDHSGDMRVDEIKDHADPAKMVALATRHRLDPTSPVGLRDPHNPCWLNRQDPGVREAMLILEEVKRDLNAERPRLYECCCRVSCNDCLLATGSCGCRRSVLVGKTELEGRVVGSGGKIPVTCPECVRTWHFNPAAGTAIFQEELRKPLRKPKPEELRSTGGPVHHEQAPRKSSGDNQ